MWQTFLFEPPRTSVEPATDYWWYTYLPACASRCAFRGSLLNRLDLSPRCAVPFLETEERIPMTMVDIRRINEACARAAHEANRAYCIALGDTSQVPWDDAPDWQKESARAGVHGVLLDGYGPRESHKGWLDEKRRTGWVYGPVKDPVAKTHPCMVPYEELPDAQKAKDQLFVVVVLAVAASLEPNALTNARAVT